MGSVNKSLQKFYNWYDYGYGASKTPNSYYLPITRTRIADDMPKFRQVISNGGNATNYMKIVEQDVIFRVGVCEDLVSGDWSLHPSLHGAHGNWRSQGAAPFVNTYRGLTVSEMDDVNNKALIGIIKKLRSQEGFLSGPTFLGELRETVRMIKSPVAGLRTKLGLFTDLRMRILRDKQMKGGRFKPESWKKVLSDTYLEFTFGVRPLLSDIAAIAEASLNKLGSYGEIRRLSYTYNDRNYNSSLESSNAPGAWLTSTIYQHRVGVGSVNYTVGMRGEIRAPRSPLQAIVDGAKFNFDEIIPTAWELLPWSFLIDYFTNIGDVLGSTWDFNAMVAWCKRVDVNNSTIFNTVYVKPTSPYNTITDFEPHVFISTNKTIERTASSLTMPTFRCSLPSLGQYQNMAALAYSLSHSNPFKTKAWLLP